jgi:hypothetical protein
LFLEVLITLNIDEQPEQRGFELWQDTDDEFARRAYLALATSGYQSLRSIQSIATMVA